MPRTTVFGVYDSGRLWRCGAGEAIISPAPAGASAATENVEDRGEAFGPRCLAPPNGLLSSAGTIVRASCSLPPVRTYGNRFGVTPGTAVSLFTTTDDGWRTARDLVSAGASVETIVDARPEVSARRTSPARATRGVVLEAEPLPTRAAAARSRFEASKSAMVPDVVEQHGDATLIAMSGGWNPNLQLTTYLGGRPKWSRRACGLRTRRRAARA